VTLSFGFDQEFSFVVQCSPF